MVRMTRRINVVDAEDWVAEPEPDRRYLIDGLVEMGSNILMAGPPKSAKTLLAQHIGTMGRAGLPIAGRYAVAEPFRTLIILTEGSSRAHKRRLHRLQLGGGALRGVKILYRPQLKFSDDASMRKLRSTVDQHDTDFLVLDHWTSLSGGVDSNNADAVQSGLGAFNILREVSPDLVIALIHHAGKDHDKVKKTITDVARGSGAFGAWFDTGMHISQNEADAIYKVKIEHRELPAPQDILFTLRDEGHNGVEPTGYLKIVAEDGAMEQIKAKVSMYEEKIRDALHAQHGLSQRRPLRCRQGELGRVSQGAGRPEGATDGHRQEAGDSQRSLLGAVHASDNGAR